MQVNDANRNRKVIAIVACVCALLQLAIVPNIGIANGRANLALVATACLALQIGGRTTVIFGFLAGLFSISQPLALSVSWLLNLPW